MTEPSIYPHFRGNPIIPSHAAQAELDKLGMDLSAVMDILENGYDCAASRRKANIIERCKMRKGKELRVVLALIEWEDKSFWRLIHVGKTGGHR